MARRKGKMQEEVLEVLRRHDQPQTAYALLAEMRADHPLLAPTTIYRALDALMERGAIHRLESLKAFVIRRHEDQGDACLMAICDECGAVEERLAPRLIDDVSAEAAKSGFAPTRHVIEVHGRCAGCEPGDTAR
ncbi:MAG: Fur family transcriptional regulator [Pseudomonadota bacterium]